MFFSFTLAVVVFLSQVLALPGLASLHGLFKEAGLARIQGDKVHVKAEVEERGANPQLVAYPFYPCYLDCPILTGLYSSAVSSIASEFCSSYIQSTVTTTCSDTILAVATSEIYVGSTTTSTLLITDTDLSIVTSFIVATTLAPSALSTSINSGSEFVTATDPIFSVVHRDVLATKTIPDFLRVFPTQSISSACSCFITPAPPVTFTLAVGPTYTSVDIVTVTTAIVTVSEYDTTTIAQTTSLNATSTATRTHVYSYSSSVIPFPSSSYSASPSSSIPSTNSTTSTTPTLTTSSTSTTSASTTSSSAPTCSDLPGCIIGDYIITTIDVPTNSTQDCEEDCAAEPECLSFQYGYPSATGHWNCNLLNATAADAFDSDGTSGDATYCDQYAIYDSPCIFQE